MKNLSSKRLTPVGWKSLEKVALVGYNLLFILVLCGGRVWKPTLYEAFLIIEFVAVCLEYLRVYSIHVYRQCFLWGSTHLAKYAREENMQSHSFWNICYFFCSESQAILKRKLKLLQNFDIKVKISVLSSVLSCVVIFPWTNEAQISKDQHWILHLFLQNQLILGYKLQRRSRLGWLWAQISKHLSRVIMSSNI